MKNKDPSAIYYPVAFADEEETPAFVLAIIFCGLAVLCAFRWHRRRKEWIENKQQNTTNN